MFNTQTIKDIANTTETAGTILGAFAKRERFRPTLNLKKFRYDLMKQGLKIVEPEFLATFRKLEEAGIGSLIRGRGGNPDKFAWNYNLKEVGSAAFSDKKELTPSKPSSIQASKPLEKKINRENRASGIQLVINLSPTADKKDVEALIALAQGLK